MKVLYVWARYFQGSHFSRIEVDFQKLRNNVCVCDWPAAIAAAGLELFQNPVAPLYSCGPTTDTDGWPQFWKKHLNYGKLKWPLKPSNLRGFKQTLDHNFFLWQCIWHAHCAYCRKNWPKISQIGPWQLLKENTAAYRGSPPCTQSQHHSNRETGTAMYLLDNDHTH